MRAGPAAGSVSSQSSRGCGVHSGWRESDSSGDASPGAASRASAGFLSSLPTTLLRAQATNSHSLSIPWVLSLPRREPPERLLVPHGRARPRVENCPLGLPQVPTGALSPSTAKARGDLLHPRALPAPALRRDPSFPLAPAPLQTTRKTWMAGKNLRNLETLSTRKYFV